MTKADSTNANGTDDWRRRTTVVSDPLDRLTGRRLTLARVASGEVDGPPGTTTTVKISRKLGEGGSAFVYLAKEKPRSTSDGAAAGGGASLTSPSPEGAGSIIQAASSTSSSLGGLLFTPRRRKGGGRQRLQHPIEESTPASPPSLVRAQNSRSSQFSPLSTQRLRGGGSIGRRRRRRLVVLKVSSVETVDGASRAVAEANMLRRLSMNHPNIVRYHGNGFLSSSSSGLADCRNNDGSDNLGAGVGVGVSSMDDSAASSAVVAPSSSSAFDAINAHHLANTRGRAIEGNVHWLMMEYCGGGSLLDLVVACRRQHVHDAERRGRGDGIGRMEEGSGCSQCSVVATSSSSRDKGGGPNGLRRVASSLLSPGRVGGGGGGDDDKQRQHHRHHRYHRRLDVQEILTIFLHICSAVSYMHSGGGDGCDEGNDDGDVICDDASSDDDDDNDDGELDREKGEGKNENEKEGDEDDSGTHDAVKVVDPPSKEDEEGSSSSSSPQPQPSTSPSTHPPPRRRRKRGRGHHSHCRRPILHLDIKLENILLVHPPSTTSSPTMPSSAAAAAVAATTVAAMGNYQERWRCKLCDLGSARVGRIPLGTAEERRNADEVVRTTTTQMYRAPEMVDLYNTAGEITEKADVWALGCCLYNVVFLRNCFDANNSNLAILAGKYDVPSKSSSSTNNNAEHDSHPYPDGLIELITDRMLVVDPERRATVDHVVDCLHALQLGWDLPPRPGPSSAASSEAGAVKDGEEDDSSQCVVPSPQSSPSSSPSRSRLIDASQDKENSPPPRKGKLLAPNSVAKRRMLLAKKRSSAAADPFSTLAASSRSQSLWNADEYDDTDGDSSSVASSLVPEGEGNGDGCVLFPAEPNDNPHGHGGGGWVNFFSTATCGGSDEVFGKKAGLPPLMRTNSSDEDRRMLMTKEPFVQERGRPLSFRVGGDPVETAKTMGVEEAGGGSGSFPRLSETPIKVLPPTSVNDGTKDDGVLVTTDESNGSSEHGSIEELTNLFARGDWVEVVEVESDNENRKCVVSPTHDCVEVSAFLPGSSSGDLNEARQRLLFSGSGE